jgi:hypothetical protein
METTRKRRDGGGDVDPANPWDRDSYRQAEETVALMRIPQFVHADNPHERLFVAGPDGVAVMYYLIDSHAPTRWQGAAQAFEPVPF